MARMWLLCMSKYELKRLFVCAAASPPSPISPPCTSNFRFYVSVHRMLIQGEGKYYGRLIFFNIGTGVQCTIEER